MVKSRLNGKVLSLILTAALITVGIIFLLFRADSKVSEANLVFLRSYGWEVEENPTEICRLTIPEEFDSVFSAYHELGKESGFDLASYQGKSATRYTYRVLNHKDSPGGLVRANVFVVKDVIIAADLCSLEPDGFLQAISNPDGQNTY